MDLLSLVKSMLAYSNATTPCDFLYSDTIIKQITHRLLTNGFISFCANKQYVGATIKDRILMISEFFDNLMNTIISEIMFYSHEFGMYDSNLSVYYLDKKYRPYKSVPTPSLIQEIDGMITILRLHDFILREIT